MYTDSGNDPWKVKSVKRPHDRDKKEHRTKLPAIVATIEAPISNQSSEIPRCYEKRGRNLATDVWVFPFFEDALSVHVRKFRLSSIVSGKIAVLHVWTSRKSTNTDVVQDA